MDKSTVCHHWHPIWCECADCDTCNDFNPNATVVKNEIQTCIININTALETKEKMALVSSETWTTTAIKALTEIIQGLSDKNTQVAPENTILDNKKAYIQKYINDEIVFYENNGRDDDGNELTADELINGIINTRNTIEAMCTYAVETKDISANESNLYRNPFYAKFEEQILIFHERERLKNE